MNIQLSTPVSVILSAFNAAVASLKGKKFEGGYANIDKMIVEALAHMSFPEGFTYSDWCLEYAYAEYDQVRLIDYARDITEDKRYINSFNNQRGVINDITFKITESFYDQNKREHVPYPENNENWTLEQLALNRHISIAQSNFVSFNERYVEMLKNVQQATQTKFDKESKLLELREQLEKTNAVAV